MSTEITPAIGFGDMGLIKPVLKALDDRGYEVPTAIQTQIIPHVLAGQDVLGQAQTGTGKTAAFALPLLSRINLKKQKPQVLVLAPTRELAIQVAEFFKSYASRMKGFQVLPVYGGQAYAVQLKQLKRGVHVVVGTPGRLMDHMERGTLKLDDLTSVVLDEADEMLRMGFIDDVAWILERTPSQKQVALFSATMPGAIRKIAQKYLTNPEEITIRLKTTTADTIHQRFWMVKGTHKLDALTRILEAEDFEAVIVFVRTKVATVELAEKLEARGYAAEPLNGDISQAARERTITRLQNGKIDLLVATDVAARGLDVERVSHVINYDIPNEAESYIHRIGRTGRAGRDGDAILFVSPRERWMLRVIEKATRQKIKMMNLPSTEAINDKRVASFYQSITDTLASEELRVYLDLLENYRQDHDVPALDIAAALAKMFHGETPLILQSKESGSTKAKFDSKRNKPSRPSAFQKGEWTKKEKDVKPQKSRQKEKMDPGSEKKNSREKGREFEQGRDTETVRPTIKPGNKKQRSVKSLRKGMERFRLDVGLKEGVSPGDIVGAISNEAGLESRYINNITIYQDHTLVDLPEGMPKEIFHILTRIWVRGKQFQISKVS